MTYILRTEKHDRHYRYCDACGKDITSKYSTQVRWFPNGTEYDFCDQKCCNKFLENGEKPCVEHDVSKLPELKMSENELGYTEIFVMNRKVEQ